MDGSGNMSKPCTVDDTLARELLATMECLADHWDGAFREAHPKNGPMTVPMDVTAWDHGKRYWADSTTLNNLPMLAEPNLEIDTMVHLADEYDAVIDS